MTIEITTTEKAAASPVLNPGQTKLAIVEFNDHAHYAQLKAVKPPGKDSKISVVDDKEQGPHKIAPPGSSPFIDPEYLPQVIAGPQPPKTPEIEAFFAAVNSGKISVVAEMLEKNPEYIQLLHPENGDTALHVAVKQNKVTLVKLLLEKAANPSRVNNDFLTPMQCLLNLRNDTEIKKHKHTKAPAEELLTLLLRHHPQANADDLQARLNFYTDYYQRGITYENHNRALLNYTVSQLIGEDIEDITHENNKENLIKYHAHLLSLQGKKEVYQKQDINLEEMAPITFLALRIHAFFAILAQIVQGLIPMEQLPKLAADLAVEENRKELIRLLKQEIITELQTLYWSRSCVTKLPKKAVTALADSIAQCVQQLADKQELCLVSGWKKHALYVNFICIQDQILVRIDNLGAGCDRKQKNKAPAHRIDTTRLPKKGAVKSSKNSSPYLYPAMLGMLKKDAFSPRQPGHIYLKNLIYAHWISDNHKALQSLYELPKPWLPTPEAVISERNYRSAKIQSAGNCVGKNHQIGLQARLGNSDLYPQEPKQHKQQRHVVYRWLRERELMGIQAKQADLQDKKNLWRRFRQLEGKPRPQVATSLVSILQQKYQDICLEGLLDGVKIVFETAYIPANVVKKSLPSQEPDTSKQSHSALHFDAKEIKQRQKLDYQLAQQKKLPTSETCISPQQLFSPEDKPQQVVITGAPGMGKSVYCQHLVKSWQNKQLWQQPFVGVVWILLRHFNQYPAKPNGAPYTIFDVFKQEFPVYSSLPDERLEEELRASCKHIVWLLDGYDELPQPLPFHLQAAMKELLAMPRVIITSRPEYALNLNQASALELCGLTEKQIQQYIQQFYLARVGVVDDHKTLLTFLQKNPSLYALGHTPALLEMICGAWAYTQVSLAEVSALTQLYTHVTHGVLFRHLTRHHPEQVISSLPEVLEKTFEQELHLLEKLAFIGIQQKALILTKEQLLATLKNEHGQTPQRWEHIFDRMLRIGILKPTDGGNRKHRDPLQRDYYFVHLSFQEFFAARYLARLLVSGSQNAQAVDWLAAHKYQKVYQPVIGFLSGLLSQADWLIFWKVIDQPPREPLGFRHAQLVMLVLRDRQEDEDELPIACVWQIQGIKQIIERDFLDGYADRRLSQHLFQQNVKLAVKMLITFLDHSNPRIRSAACDSFYQLHQLTAAQKTIQALIDRLSDVDENVKKAAIRALGNLASSTASQGMVQALLVEKLRDKDEDVRRSAISVLGNLGPLAATPEVLQVLVERLAHKEEDVSRSAINLLKNLGPLAATPEVLHALVESLANKEKDVRLRAIAALEKLGPSAASPAVLQVFVEKLTDKEEDVKLSAIVLLGKLGRLAAAPEVIQALVQKLTDKDRGIRQSAIAALGKLGPSAVTPAVMQALVERLVHKEEDVRLSAIGLLENLGRLATTPEVIQVFVERLADESEHLSRRVIAILRRLGPLAATPEVMQALMERMAHKEEYVRRRAFDVLGELGPLTATPEMLQALVERLRDESRQRLGAIKALQRLGLLTATAEIMQVLGNSLADKNPEVRLSAIAALEQLGPLAATAEVMQALVKRITEDGIFASNSPGKLLVKLVPFVVTPSEVMLALVNKLWGRDGDFGVFRATAALEQLGALAATAEVMEALVKGVAYQKHSRSGENLLRKLAQAATAEVMQALVERLAYNNDERVRLSAINTIGKLLAEPATQALVRKLADKDEEVRWTAIDKLGGLGRLADAATPEVIRVIVERLADKSCIVRGKALARLGKLGHLAATPEVIQALMRRLADENEEVRWTAIDTLVELGRLAEAVTPEVMQALVGGLTDKAWRVNKSAMAALNKLDPLAATPADFRPLIAQLKDKNKNVQNQAASALLEVIESKQWIELIVEQLLEKSTAPLQKNSTQKLVKFKFDGRFVARHYGNPPYFFSLIKGVINFTGLSRGFSKLVTMAPQHKLKALLNSAQKYIDQETQQKLLKVLIEKRLYTACVKLILNGMDKHIPMTLLRESMVQNYILIQLVTTEKNVTALVLETADEQQEITLDFEQAQRAESFFKDLIQVSNQEHSLVPQSWQECCIHPPSTALTNAPAWRSTGIDCVISSDSGAESSEKTIAHLQQQAEAGDANALLQLGSYHIDKALAYLRRAMQKNHPLEPVVLAVDYAQIIKALSSAQKLTVSSQLDKRQTTLAADFIAPPAKQKVSGTKRPITLDSHGRENTASLFSKSKKSKTESAEATAANIPGVSSSMDNKPTPSTSTYSSFFSSSASVQKTLVPSSVPLFREQCLQQAYDLLDAVCPSRVNEHAELRRGFLKQLAEYKQTPGLLLTIQDRDKLQKLMHTLREMPMQSIYKAPL